MKLTYQGFELSGKAASGTIEAADAAEARETLRARGVLVTVIQGADSPAKPGVITRVTARPGTRGGRVTITDLAHFFRQLSILVSTHTPLAQAIEVLAKQATNPAFQHVLADLSRRVHEGQDLSDAMAEHPAVFDAVCRSMTSAGESGGSMDAMLKSSPISSASKK